MIPDDAEPHPDTGILRQIDLFFGRRHRFHYLVVGFVTGVLVFWGAQTQIFNPSNNKTLERELQYIEEERQVWKIDSEHLLAENERLRDSVDQINSYGIHLGRFTFDDRGEKRMVGGILTATYWGDEYLSVAVDSLPDHEDKGAQYFEALLGVGIVNPIFHGSMRFNLICREVTDSTLTIDVYERR